MVTHETTNTSISMFFHLQYIHLFRPFLKYVPSASPLPSHVSPRRICTANASAISKLMRLYKKTYNLRQICNIAVYMIHSSTVIHLLNLPEKTAKRDVIHGVKHLEEIAEDWLCARRTLCIISVLAKKWNVELPEEASVVLQRSDEKYGQFSTSDVPSPIKTGVSGVAMTPSPPPFPTSPASSANHEQYNQSTPPQLPEIPTSTMPELMDTMARLSPPNLQNQIPKSMAQPMGNPALTMNEALTGGGSWAMPGVTQPLPAYPQNFAPMPSGINSAQTSQTGSTRQMSPNSLFAIDGQDWFLKDGVSWQQNFETWGLGQRPSNGQGNMPDMYMFRGLRSPDMDTTFDSLNNSMNNLDHLPGLD